MPAEERTPLLANGQQSYNAASEEVDVAAEQDTQTTQQQQPTSIPPKVQLILMSMMLSVFVSAMDQTIIAAILTRIGTDFNKSNLVSFIATSYLLTTTAFQPLYGRLSDIFGRREAMLFALIVFLIGSVGCGASSSLNELIFWRAFSGIGGGGILTTSSIIMSDFVPLAQRGVWHGAGNAAFGIAGMVGAPLGGLFADTIGWRWAFYINVPLTLVTVFAVAVLAQNYDSLVINKSTTVSDQTVGQKLKRIDYLGMLALVTGIGSIMLGTSLGGNELPWSNPIVVSSLVVGVVFVLIFVYVEAKIASEPIMPLRILFLRTPLVVYICYFFATGAGLAVIYLVPLYMRAILDLSSTAAGAHLVSRIIAGSVGSLGAGVYMARTGKYLWFTWVSVFMMLAGDIWITFGWTRANYVAPEWVLIAPLIFEGAGLVSFMTTGLVAMLAHIDPKDMAVASAMTYLFRSTGSSLIVSASQAVLQGVLKSELEAHVTGPNAEWIIEQARKNADTFRQILPPEAVGLVIDAYRIALRYSFGFACICTLVALLASFWMEPKDLKKEEKKRKEALAAGDGNAQSAVNSTSEA
ncbi:major facilitator superfamily domain-containing protein [Cladochytrium replicatum]|nr:major facilitator superfamily domain-containing protein [Cladochytrium replicatum]